MVYCGKPSKACAQCRTRRTKCDTLRPSCSQCLRAGRTCSGYRDPSALIFRIQNDHLAIKHGGQVPRPQPNGESASMAVATRSLGHSFKYQAPALLDLFVGTLFPTLEEQATCFFFSNYVWEEYKGYFRYLPTTLNALPAKSPLGDAILSLGLAGLASSTMQPHLMVKSNVKYTSALHSISASLRDVDEAKKDQTLLSVLLLGLYETNTCSAPRSMKSWTKHITGASAIVHLRGKKQLQNSIGRDLFVQIRSQVLTNSLQRHVPVPKCFIEWSKYAAQFETSEEAFATTLSEIVTDYCTIRSRMSSFRDYTDSANVVYAVLRMDARLAEWASSCPPEFTYDTIQISEPSPEVYTDHYHVYQSIRVASAWNSYRCVRILVNELLLVHLSYLSLRQSEAKSSDAQVFPYDAQFMFAEAVLQRLTQEICASVPFYLEYHKIRDRTATALTSPKSISGNLLLWPLYTAASMDIIPGMMRAWLVDKMYQVGERLGIQQASALANVLDCGRRVTVWEISDTVDAEPEDW